jgi:hypothetical protein
MTYVSIRSKSSGQEGEEDEKVVVVDVVLLERETKLIQDANYRQNQSRLLSTLTTKSIEVFFSHEMESRKEYKKLDWIPEKNYRNCKFFMMQ